MKFKILSKKGVAVVLAATLAMGSFAVSATGLIDEPVFTAYAGGSSVR